MTRAARARERPAADAAPLPLPRWIVAGAIVAVAVAVVAIAALVLRTDPSTLVPLITSPSALTALWLSLRTAAIATLLCLVLGVPLGVLLARIDGRLASVLRTVALLPLVLPPVIGGIALLYTFGRRGLVGQLLESLGIQIAFTTTAVVIAQTFVAMPFLVVSVEAALRTLGTRYERVAATLGASPSRTLWRVTLPLAAPAIVAGTVLCFARALGEFGATLAFAGSLEGTTRTLPLEIYLVRETDASAAVALSIVLVAVAVVVMASTGAARMRR